MGTLQDLVIGGYDGFAMTETSHLPILVQIARGIDYLHQLGIVHGNLKPTNVLVSFPNEENAEPRDGCVLSIAGTQWRCRLISLPSAASSDLLF